MNTRNHGIYFSGFYNQTSLIVENEEIVVKKAKNKKMANMSNLIKSINYNILSKLYSSRKLSPTTSFNIMIDNKIFQYLKKNFNINGRYQESKLFMESFNIKLKGART